MFDMNALRTMTAQDMATLGFGRIAYIRAISVQGEEVFAVMGADGRQLGLASDRESADIMAHRNDLSVVPLH